jgi:hypothetical protein
MTIDVRSLSSVDKTRPAADRGRCSSSFVSFGLRSAFDRFAFWPWCFSSFSVHFRVIFAASPFDLLLLICLVRCGALQAARAILVARLLELISTRESLSLIAESFEFAYLRLTALLMSRGRLASVFGVFGAFAGPRPQVLPLLKSRRATTTADERLLRAPSRCPRPGHSLAGSLSWFSLGR